MIERLKKQFSDSIQTTIHSADMLLPPIAIACEKIMQCLLEGHKILTCGNGGSAADAMRFASNMLNRFKHERPGLPVISLVSEIAAVTSIANESDYGEIFSKQLRALGQSSDILLALSTRGNSENILNAVKAAHDKNISVIALTGGNGGKLGILLNKEKDIEIRIPSFDTARIQEIHLLVLHCICDNVDHQLFGHEEVSI